MNIKWYGPILNGSGYAKANRDYIKSLLFHERTNIKIGEHKLISCERGKEKYYNFPIYEQLVKNDIDYDKVVYNCIPNQIPHLIEKDKKSIGISTWETDRIPGKWFDIINNLDLQIVPSSYNADVYEFCGINTPIKVIPHCIDIDYYQKERPSILPKELENHYKFLSVFQWTERKNPTCLLLSYLTEFKPNENVVLILRVYGSNHSMNEQKRIINEIKTHIHNLNIQNTPQIYFIGDQLTDDEMISLYNECDCFVLPSRSEGFGLPILEAMACKKPVISTNHGAVKELIIDNKNGFLIDSRDYPVCNMRWINEYNAYQIWGDPDPMHLRYIMRFLYENIDTGINMGKYGEIIARNKYSYKVIGEQLYDALKNV
ncbi:MAG: glycosyltransferase family 4 protein [archaeon]